MSGPVLCAALVRERIKTERLPFGKPPVLSKRTLPHVHATPKTLASLAQVAPLRKLAVRSASAARSRISVAVPRSPSAPSVKNDKIGLPIFSNKETKSGSIGPLLQPLYF